MRINAFQINILIYIAGLIATIASFAFIIRPLGYPLWALVAYGILTVVLVYIGAMFAIAAYGIRHGKSPEYEIGLRGIHKV